MTHEEKALLGAIISRANAVGVALECVQPEDFSSPAGRAIYQAIVHLSRDAKVVDPILLGNVLDGPLLEEMGGRAFLHTLVDACPYPLNARGYARAVREASIDRQARRVVASAAGTGTEYVTAVQEGLFGIERREQQGADAQTTARAILGDMGKMRPGLEYPWREVQQCTRGLRPGWLCVVAGEPSHGKSCAGFQISTTAVHAGKRVVYNSLEMSDRDCVARIAMRQGMSGERYWADKLRPEDVAILEGIAGDPQWANFRVETADKVAQLAPLCRRWGADLLVVDHLQLLAGERYEDLSAATRQLKLLAGSLDIPVLLLSQLNRGTAEQDDAIPRLKRLRGSGTIEQDADTVVFVWRKRGPTGELTDEAAISIAKSRNGRTASLRAAFDGDRQEFRIVTAREGGA